MNNIRIIGVAGTNGSGKDTVGKILASEHNYLFISVTELLRAECRRRGLPVEREHLRTISAEWRRKEGLGVLCERSIAEYKKVQDKYNGVVMASLRNPGEADSVHQHDGIVLWIDANPKTRYDRIQMNAVTRGRAEEDNKSFEQFLAEEEAEMHASGDAATLDMASVKAKADIFISNDGNDLTLFQQDIEQALNLQT
ncbi:MAG TPA: AAA family ATPase [Candidatus Saccharimonadales bacterium]|nr:AAA family ATPase [Candidatus Saccharimonadales bacterium]